jgi:hypothetical protein
LDLMRRMGKQQVPPLHYAPVGITLLLAELATRPDTTGGRR